MLQKGWIDTKSQARKPRSFIALNEEGLEAKNVANPNPRAKATVLEGDDSVSREREKRLN